ncbi:hypothetical protein D3C78_1676200 [compost metagenome]
MYSHTLARIAHTASSSECCTVNMVIGIEGCDLLISSSRFRPLTSGLLKWMQIISTCRTLSQPAIRVVSPSLHSQTSSNCWMSLCVDLSRVRSSQSKLGLPAE